VRKARRRKEQLNIGTVFEKTTPYSLVWSRIIEGVCGIRP